MRYTYVVNTGRLLLVLALITAILLMLVSCVGMAPETVEPDDTAVEDWVEDWISSREKAFLPAGVDGRRTYSFDSKSISTWVNEEGDEILDVLVAIDYADNPGVAVRDEQQWHIDLKNNRYKISDSFSYDRDGSGCET
jgi:hypothetical protein